MLTKTWYLPLGRSTASPPRFDAEEVLVERVGLQARRRPARSGRPSGRSRVPCCRSCGVDPREAGHERAGGRAEVEGVQPVEEHAAVSTSSRSRRKLSTNTGPAGCVADAEHEVRDAAQQQLAAGPRFLAHVKLLQRQDQRALPRRHDRLVVHAGPVVAGGCVADFDAQVDAARSAAVNRSTFR